MPLYQYKCPEPACAAIVEFRAAPDGDQKKLADARGLLCPECGTPVRRVFQLTFTPVLHSHYNPTVGNVVSGYKDFKTQLRIAGQQQEERTGIPTDFQPVDHRDLFQRSLEKNGDAGLKEQHDAAVKAGLKEPTGRKVL